MSKFSEIFSMFKPAQYVQSNTLPIRMKRNFDKEDRQMQGMALGEIGELKQKLNSDPDNIDLNKQMYSKMGQAGYGQDAINNLFPKQRNSASAQNLEQKQMLMSEMGKVDSELALVGKQYLDALKSGDKELADNLYNQGNNLRATFYKSAFSPSHHPKSWAMFKQKPINTDNLGAQSSKQIVFDAWNKMKNGEITPEEYQRIYFEQDVIASGYGKEIVDIQDKVQEQENKQADANMKKVSHNLQLSEAENKLFQQSIANMQKFKVMESLDAYNKYLPTLKAEYESAKQGKAGSQRAIVVAFNKLIEPSSAVMEGDFRSSGNNAIASTTQALKDGAGAVLSGNYDQLGRKLSSDEIEAIYQSSLRIADALKGSIQSRVNSEENLLKNNMGKYGFTYQPNSFRNYIGIGSSANNSGNYSGNNSKLNPKDFPNLGAYRRAGGTRAEWFEQNNKGNN